MLTRRMICMATAAKKPDHPIVAARKAYEKKRIVTLKENLNKLITIGTQDTKEFTDFMKEMDDLHKNAFFKKTEVDEETVVDEEESLFLKKD